jgi:hypothetical protein
MIERFIHDVVDWNIMLQAQNSRLLIKRFIHDAPGSYAGMFYLK